MLLGRKTGGAGKQPAVRGSFSNTSSPPRASSDHHPLRHQLHQHHNKTTSSPPQRDLLDVSQVEMYFPELVQSMLSMDEGAGGGISHEEYDDHRAHHHHHHDVLDDDIQAVIDEQQQDEDSDWDDDEDEAGRGAGHLHRGGDDDDDDDDDRAGGGDDDDYDVDEVESSLLNPIRRMRLARLALSGGGGGDDSDGGHYYHDHDNVGEDDDDDDDGYGYDDADEDQARLADHLHDAPGGSAGPPGAVGAASSSSSFAKASSSSAAPASSSSNLATLTRNALLRVGGFVKRELNKARKSSGVSKRKFARVLVRKKQVQELVNVRCIQRIEAHAGPVWCLEFSSSSGSMSLLATGGVDFKVLIWHARSSSRPNTSEPQEDASTTAAAPLSDSSSSSAVVAGVQVTPDPLLHGKPMRTLVGHVGDVLSLAWSRSNFLASSSVDKTVRVWYPMQSDSCLSVMKHPDLVTGVDFHPEDDSLLLTTCFDKQVRLWDVTTGACLQRMQTPSYITSCKFNLTGDFAVVGLYTGHCVFYQVTPTYGGGGGGGPSKSSMSMRYFTQIECRNKTGLQKKGRKVTRIRFVYLGTQEHMLVTTNESRCRLYTMDDFSLQCKYRGSLNSVLQIGASCSEDGRHIICGSEDRQVVVWRTKNDLVKSMFGRQGKKLLCDTHESFRGTDSGVITAAQFAPDRLLQALPHRRAKSSVVAEPTPPHAAAAAVMEDQEVLQADDAVGLRGAVIICAGFDGVLAVFDSL